MIYSTYQQNAEGRIIESQNNNLSQRIINIQQGMERIDDLILEYIPFIKSTIYKTTGRHVNDSSEEMSVGLLAFDEAVKSFDHKKGSFLSFAGWVIRRRTIDYMRKASKTQIETNFSDLSNSQIYRINNTASSENTLVDNPLKLEIDALTIALKKYDIEFEDLVSVSPKAKKTKQTCIIIIRYIIDNPAITAKMKKSGRLPIKDFKEKLKIPRKFIDRHRKYIITVVEILSGDYVYLKEYVAFMKKGERI